MYKNVIVTSLEMSVNMLTNNIGYFNILSTNQTRIVFTKHNNDQNLRNNTFYVMLWARFLLSPIIRRSCQG